MGDLSRWDTISTEQLCRSVGQQPVLEDLKVLRVVADSRKRNLVCSPRAFDLHSVDLVRTRPPLGRTQHDHRPANRLDIDVAVAVTRIKLNCLDLSPRLREYSGKSFVHPRQVVTFNFENLVPVALHQLAQLARVLAG